MRDQRELRHPATTPLLLLLLADRAGWLLMETAVWIRVRGWEPRGEGRTPTCPWGMLLMLLLLLLVVREGWLRC